MGSCREAARAERNARDIRRKDSKTERNAKNRFLLYTYLGMRLITDFLRDSFMPRNDGLMVCVPLCSLVSLWQILRGKNHPLSKKV